MKQPLVTTIPFAHCVSLCILNKVRPMPLLVIRQDHSTMLGWGGIQEVTGILFLASDPGHEDGAIAAAIQERRKPESPAPAELRAFVPGQYLSVQFLPHPPQTAGGNGHG